MNSDNNSSNHHNSRHNGTRSRAMRSRDRGRDRSPRADESRAQSPHHDIQTPGLRFASRASRRADTPRRLPDGTMTMHLHGGREVLVQGPQYLQRDVSLIGDFEDVIAAFANGLALLGTPEHLEDKTIFWEIVWFGDMPLWSANRARSQPSPPSL